LGYHLEFDNSSGHQTGLIVSQEIVEKLAIQAAKVRNRAVIDLDAPTDPPIRIVLLSRYAPRTSNLFERGKQPQGKKNFRGNRRASRAAYDRPDSGVQPGQVLPLDVDPYQPRPVPFRQQAFQIAHLQFHLKTIRHQHSRRRLRLLQPPETTPANSNRVFSKQRLYWVHGHLSKIE
jgi:hypothetical protein